MRTAKETSEAARHGMKPKRRLSTMSLPGLRKRSMHAIVSPVTSEGFIEADDPDIAKLEKRLQELQTSVLQTRSTAAPLDDLFDNLLRFLDGECPVSPEPLRSPSVLSTYSSSSHDSYRRARKTVSARDDAYLVTRTTAEALRRACRIVQAAHRLYREAKEDIETVCGPERGRLAIIFSDEESRNKTYLEAATRAQEAQGCFDECVSVLKPHWDLLTRPEVEAYDNLRNTGLLQAATLYRLMYGGANFDMGIKQSVQFMLQRQNDVYVQLTNFAAGVQNCTAHCDTVEREACESRNAARRQLIGVYVGADGNSMPMNHGSLETLA